MIQEMGQHHIRRKEGNIQTIEIGKGRSLWGTAPIKGCEGCKTFNFALTGQLGFTF